MEKKKRVVRPLSASSLDRAALFALGRRAYGRAELRAVLVRKAERAARVHGPHPEAGIWIEALLDRYVASGLLDDTRVAEGRAANGRRAGRSGRAIRARLVQKGIDAELATRALAEVDAAHAGAAELDAAITWARKRGLVRKAPDKALAALARQGFAYGVAKQALARLVDEG